MKNITKLGGQIIEMDLLSFWLMAALEAVIMATSGETWNENFVTMTTFLLTRGLVSYYAKAPFRVLIFSLET